jgi:hypothetical protein
MANTRRLRRLHQNLTMLPRDHAYWRRVGDARQRFFDIDRAGSALCIGLQVSLFLRASAIAG